MLMQEVLCGVVLVFTFAIVYLSASPLDPARHTRGELPKIHVFQRAHTLSPGKKRCHETGCVTNGNSFQPGRPPGLIYYAMIVSGTNDCQI